MIAIVSLRTSRDAQVDQRADDSSIHNAHSAPVLANGLRLSGTSRWYAVIALLMYHILLA